MGNFNRGDRYGAGRSFGGGRDFNNRGADRPMHPAVCSKCGKECEVPFKPTGRPVFCSDCFRANRDADPRGGERGNFSKPRFDNRSDTRSKPVESSQCKEQFDTLNSKIDKILNLLTSVVPSEDDPVQEEKIAKEEEGLRIDKQAPVAEKKKKAPKKTPGTPEE